jgi:hypothetical protein
MEGTKITQETVKEVLASNPDITMEQFLRLLHTRWSEEISSHCSRETQVILSEYRATLLDLLKQLKKE